MTRLDLFDPCFLTPPSTLLLFLYTTMSLNNRFSLIRIFPFVFDESHSLPTDSLRGEGWSNRITQKIKERKSEGGKERILRSTFEEVESAIER